MPSSTSIFHTTLNALSRNSLLPKAKNITSSMLNLTTFNQNPFALSTSFRQLHLNSSFVSLRAQPLYQRIQNHPCQKPTSSAFSQALSTQAQNTAVQEPTNNNIANNRYDWIDEEAHQLILKAYNRHKALADKSQSFPPSLSVKDLEKIGIPYHYAPKNFVDRIANGAMKFMRVFVHAFFRQKYDHHAVCLETVAAVPGLVGSFHRHLRSLRRMKRDHGWITVLQEEAENERMHLLIFMRVTKPTSLERGIVVFAQGLYLTFYSALYLTSPRAAHRLTGYLEEEAHRAYTEYLRCIDNGQIKNKPAPDIAKNYYHLDEEATMRDVILHIRADEAMHRDVNHHLGNKYSTGDTDSATNTTDSYEEQDIAKRM